MATTIVASPIERARAEHRQAYSSYMLRVRCRVRCVGHLCPPGATSISLRRSRARVDAYLVKLTYDAGAPDDERRAWRAVRDTLRSA